MTQPGHSLRKLPAALLHLSVAPEAEPILAALESYDDPARGMVQLGPGSWAYLPIAGDPAVFDVAVYWGQRLLGEALQRLEAAALAPEVRALVFPGDVLCGDEVTTTPEPLRQDLEQRPPRFAVNAVMLTARAAQGLEIGRRLGPGATYEGTAGRSVPLVRLGPALPEAPPWRCPEVLSSRTKFVPRPDVSAALQELLIEPAARVVGDLGAGKTRLVWEALRAPGTAAIWATVRSARCGGLGLDQQLVRRLGLQDTSTAGGAATNRVATLLTGLADRQRRGEGPLWLVCDGVESASANDWRLIGTLLGARELGSAFQLLLLARRGTVWPPFATALPQLEVPTLGEAEMRALADQLFAGLSLPTPLAEELLAASAGNPWALEEGIVQLASDHRLRRVVGSFFFSSAELPPYTPSARLVRHVEAELLRLGDAIPMRILAAAEAVVPPAEVRAAGQLADLAIASAWEVPYLDAGWLRQEVGPWGDGLAYASRALGSAVARTLPPAGQRVARHWLGELLAGLELPGEARWQSYRLLAGTPEGARLLLGAVGNLRIPRAEIFAALRSELAALARGEGDSALELDLLWALIPVGRRLSRLHEVSRALDRSLELTGGEGERFVAFAMVKSQVATNAGELSTAETLLRRALAVARGTDVRRQAQLCFELGRVLQRLGRPREASELLEHTLTALERDRRGALAAQCRYHLGNLALHAGRLDDAETHHRGALAERRASGLLGPIASSLTALGSVALAHSTPLQALAHFREAEALLVEHGRAGEVAFALLGIGLALGRLGDFVAATGPLRRALGERQGRDDPHGEAIARLAVAENHFDLGQPEAALSETRRALFQLSLEPESDAWGDAEQLLGRILLHQRKLDEADAHLGEALRIHRALGRPQEAAHDLRCQLESALAREDAKAIEKRCVELADAVASLDRADAPERLALHLFRGFDWLASHGRPAQDPLPWLARAYDELLRQTAPLAPEDRHRFLLQIADHQQTLELARRHGLVSGVLKAGG